MRIGYALTVYVDVEIDAKDADRMTEDEAVELAIEAGISSIPQNCEINLGPDSDSFVRVYMETSDSVVDLEEVEVR